MKSRMETSCKMIILALVGAGPAIAVPKSLKSAPPPATVQRVIECRALPDSAARLACYDDAVQKLDAAQKSKDIIVVDREQVQETKKSLFGFSLSGIDIFGGDKDKDEIKEIQSKIVSASTDGDANWIIRLENGTTWQQTDGNPIPSRPRSGDPVTIRRASLGSFFLVVGKQSGVKARRIN